jgi:hypothetical protein
MVKYTRLIKGKGKVENVHNTHAEKPEGAQHWKYLG